MHVLNASQQGQLERKLGWGAFSYIRVLPDRFLLKISVFKLILEEIRRA
jgi:hypothetical protein